MPNFKLGYEAKLFVGTKNEAPSTEVTNATDIEVSLNCDAVDVTARNSGAFKVYIPGMIDAELSFKIFADASDTQLNIIRSAWLARTPIAVKVELGDGYAFQCDAIVTDMSNSQTVDDAVAYNVTLKPTIDSDTFKPQVIVATSASQNP